MNAETPSIPVRSARRLDGIRAYSPPTNASPIDLRLDANEGRADPELIRRALDEIDVSTINRYPSARDLESLIAEAWGVEPERIVVTNGADDSIERVCKAILDPGAGVLIHDPTFVMIEHSARLAGANVRRVPWIDGDFPIEEYLGSIDQTTRLIAVVSPNNPTGRAVDLDLITRIAAKARGFGCVVMVDLAYVEFAESDPTRELLGMDNIVIVRTFSKAFGLASARVGYTIAPDPVCDWVRACGSPYPCSTISLALSQSAFERGPDRGFIERIRLERERLTSTLTQLGTSPIGSSANFVLARFRDAPAAKDSLARRGIAVRGFTGGLGEMLRITLPGNETDFNRLIESLRAALPTGEPL